MDKRIKRLISFLIAFVLVIGYLPFQPVTKVVAADTKTLDVTKDIDWTYGDTTAEISVTSDLPELKDTQVLFMGTLCSAHSLTAQTIIDSIEAIAKNADVDYYLLDSDNNNNNYRLHSVTERNETYQSKGSVKRGSSMTTDQKKPIVLSSSNHNAIKGFVNLLNEILITSTNKKSYDYIVFEFDGSRIAYNSSSINDTVASNVATELKKYYEANKVIWVTDGQKDETTSNPTYGVFQYYPRNFMHSRSNNYSQFSRYYLSTEAFARLCILCAPDYYLKHTNHSNTEYYGSSSSAFVMENYTLEVGKRSVENDYVNGRSDSNPPWAVYPNTARQLYYNEAKELADFLYMAIEGATLKFDDKIQVADNLTIKKVGIYVSKKPTTTTSPTPTPSWISFTDEFIVANGTSGSDNGVSYVTDSKGIIKVTTGNNSAEDNQVSITVKDVKNQIQYVKVVITVEDSDGFKSCITRKLNANGTPATDSNGYYIYEMNPNDGPVTVTAYHDGAAAGGSGTALGTGTGTANAPAVPTCSVVSSVTGGSQSYNTTNQIGQVITTTPYTVRMPLESSAVLEYTPTSGYQFESITIDGTTVTLQNGAASGTATNGTYSVSTDAVSGKVTVTLSGNTSNRTVDVVFDSLVPGLTISKTVTVGGNAISPTPAPQGTTVTYSINVTNTDADHGFSNISVEDVIPTGLANITNYPTTASYDSATRKLSWTTSVAKGGTSTMTFNATVPGDLDKLTTYDNTAKIVSANGYTYPTPPEATATFQAQPETVLLEVQKDWSDSWSEHTGTTVYVALFRNGTKINAPNSTNTNGYIELTASNPNWTGEVRKINPNTSEAYTYTFKEISANDAKQLSDGEMYDEDYKAVYNVNTNTNVTKITNTYMIKPADFAFNKVADVKTAKPGDTITYTLTVENTRSAEDAKAVVVEDVIPSGLAYKSYTSSNGDVDFDPNSNKLTWTVDVDHGSTVTLDITVEVPADTVGPVEYENIAVITKVDNTEYSNSQKSSPSARTDVMSFDVEKVWEDPRNDIPSSVEIQLFRSDNTTTPVATYTLTAADVTTTGSWKHTFTNLEVYDSSNHVYTYTVAEATVDGFTNKIDYADLQNRGMGNTYAKITNTRKSYQIAYSFDGTAPSGVTPPASVTKYWGDNYSVEPTPSVTNWVFEGWYTDTTDPAGSKFTGATINDTTAPNGVLTLYGKWTEKPEVSYQFVGNDIPNAVTTPASVRVTPGAKYTAEATPSAQYYSFTGWCSDAECNTPYTDGTEINADKTLFGKWERLTAVLGLQPATNGPAPTDAVYPSPATLNQGDTVPVPDAPTYSGDDFTFGGWYTDPDGRTPYTPAVLGASGLQLYAVWIPNISVFYTFANTVPSAASLPSTAKIPTGAKYNAVNPNSVAGYTFNGWYLDPSLDKASKYSNGTVLSADTYLYGEWIPIDPGAKTGDDTHTVAWASLLLVSAAGFVFLFCFRKKEAEQ